MAGLIAQPVGFVVKYVPAPLVLKGQVNKAFEHALHRVKLQFSRPGAQRVVVGNKLVQLFRVESLDGQVELHLDPACVIGQVHQPHLLAIKRCVETVKQHAFDGRQPLIAIASPGETLLHKPGEVGVTIG